MGDERPKQPRHPLRPRAARRRVHVRRERPPTAAALPFAATAGAAIRARATLAAAPWAVPADTFPTAAPLAALAALSTSLAALATSAAAAPLAATATLRRIRHRALATTIATITAATFVASTIATPPIAPDAQCQRW